MDSPYYMTSQKLNWTSECCWSWSVAAIFVWHVQTIARTIAHGNYRMGVRILTWEIKSSVFTIFGKIVWISINITCWLTKNGKYTKIGVPWTDSGGPFNEQTGLAFPEMLHQRHYMYVKYMEVIWCRIFTHCENDAVPADADTVTYNKD